MIVTKKWLIKNKVSKKDLEWFLKQEETELFKLIGKLRGCNLDLAIWLIMTAMTRKQAVEYAVVCAELALPIHEQVYPEDTMARTVFAATRKALEEDSEGNIRSARAAAADIITDIAACGGNYWQSALDIGIEILKKGEKNE